MRLAQRTGNFLKPYGFFCIEEPRDLATLA
jgi:hypothetical protein